jgi:hypothetical protein
MLILLTLLSTAFAQSPTPKPSARNLAEKTYTRDNTFCHMGKKRIEIQIRSFNKFTEPKEKGYGENFFYVPLKKEKLLELNKDQLNSYRFFKGIDSLCSKSLGFLIKPHTLAILFLKENRPDEDKLTLQLFDIKSALPGKIIETDYMVDAAEAYEDGFIFRTLQLRSGTTLGKLKIAGQDFIYQDRQFSYWMKYGPSGFEMKPGISFEKFQWKAYFKEEKDFLEATGWDESEKKFKNHYLYIAINHALKKECILLTPAKMVPTGSEPGWHCSP